MRPSITTVVVVMTTSALVLNLVTACSPKREAAPPASTTTRGRDSAVIPTPGPVPVVDTSPTAPKPAPRPAAGTTSKPKPVATAPQATTTSAPSAEAAPVHDQWHPAPRDTLDGDTYQGWKQFELNCSRCHGEYAVGSSFAPALVVSLKEGGTVPTKEAFMTTVCAGRLDKGMPSWCALGLEMSKIEEIYKYVKGRADGRIAAGRPALRE